MKAIWAVVTKDLQVFFTDRRATIISFAVPIALASFMAMMFGGVSSGTSKPKPIDIVVANSDPSPKAKAIVKSLSENPQLKVQEMATEEAKKAVKDGKYAVGVVLEPGFAEAAQAALMGGERPKLEYLTDPSQNVSAQMAKGAVIQSIIAEIAPRPTGAKSDDSLPFQFDEQQMSAPDQEKVSMMAHLFVGMAIQGILFLAIEAGMGLVRQRTQGIWKRLIAAPISQFSLLMGSFISGAIRALAVLAGVMLFGVLFFHIQVTGSVIGFVLVCLATACMSSSIGLMIASLGKTEQQSRGLSVLVILMMTMLSGAWFPPQIMPDFLRKATMVIPARWSVDGLDAMTWRGGDLQAAMMPTLVLLGFSLLFYVRAQMRFSKLSNV